MSDPFSDLPKRGDIHGDPYPGHRVQKLQALIVVQADGTEGLASMWMVDDAGQPRARFTFVASHPDMLAELQRTAAQLTAPPGGRLEWREFQAVIA